MGIDLDLAAPIRPFEVGLPLVFNPIFSNHRPHPITHFFGLSQFILIHLSQVTDEMGSQGTVFIGPPGPDMDKKAWEMNPVRFEEDELIPLNI